MLCAGSRRFFVHQLIELAPGQRHVAHRDLKVNVVLADLGTVRM